MITSRKAVYNGQTITVYSGLRSDALPTYAQENDRFRNLDDDITYIFTENGWAELVEGEGGGGSNPILENAIQNGGIGWYESRINIEWDGNTEGRDVIEGVLYKVSDLTPSKEDCIGGELVTEMNGAEAVFTITEALIHDYSEEIDTIYMIGDPNVVVVTSDTYVEEGLLFPRGIYFLKAVAHGNNLRTKSLKTGTYSKIKPDMVEPSYRKITVIKCYDDESMQTENENISILFDGLEFYFLFKDVIMFDDEQIYFDIGINTVYQIMSIYGEEHMMSRWDFSIIPSGKSSFKGAGQLSGTRGQVMLDGESSVGVYKVRFMSGPM